MARKKYFKEKMGRTGVFRLTTNNPFTPEETSFADLINDADLDAGVVRHLQEKKVLVEKRKPQGIKGYPPVQAILDLHGETALSAEQKTMSFVHTCIQRGLKTIQIITGKGLHSPGGVPVLPDVVEAKLVVLKQEGVIFNFRWEKKLKDKSGSVWVYL